MSALPRCYAVRRLNPLHGVLQVVEVAGARALSGDGLHWEIQVLAARPEHSWHSPNQHQPIMQYFRFGLWTSRHGLGRVPVSPILDLDSMLAASDRITAILPECRQRLPFPPGDPYELWLLDAQGNAVALVASAVNPDAIQEGSVQPWSACALREHGFHSPSLLARGIPIHDGHNPRRHAAEVERLVSRRVGHHPASRAWYLRRRGEADRRMEGQPALPEGGFPPLPLCELWETEQEVELVRDYLHWCAPALLTLYDLPPATRQRLEQAARSQALEVDKLHRLYPEVVDQGLIDATRVEARLRASND